MQTLRSLVHERGLRQDWIARQLGVSPSAISVWFRGTQRMPIAVIRPLAQVLNVSTETIVIAAERTMGLDPDCARPPPNDELNSELIQG